MRPSMPVTRWWRLEVGRAPGRTRGAHLPLLPDLRRSWRERFHTLRARVVAPLRRCPQIESNGQGICDVRVRGRRPAHSLRERLEWPPANGCRRNAAATQRSRRHRLPALHKKVQDRVGVGTLRPQVVHLRAAAERRPRLATSAQAGHRRTATSWLNAAARHAQDPINNKAVQSRRRRDDTCDICQSHKAATLAHHHVGHVPQRWRSVERRARGRATPVPSATMQVAQETDAPNTGEWARNTSIIGESCSPPIPADS